jgi:ankyrin repeat protein
MGSRALVEAIKRGDVAAVETIIAADPNALTTNEEPGSPLLTALYHGQLEIAGMIADRIDLDVFEAAASGNPGRLEQLISADSSITRQATDGWTPLHLAAFFGRTAAAQVLMDAGADLKAVSANSTGNTPLHAALAGRGDEKLILMMLRAGADAGAATVEGYTPIHIAASRGSQQMCDLLVEYGAQAGAKMSDGKTPADIAAETNHDGLAEYLRRQA